MELNGFQIVGALMEKPRRASTSSGTELLELLIENIASDGYNGGSAKLSYVSVNLTGNFSQYENLQAGQVVMVNGRLDGTQMTSQQGSPYFRIKLRPQSVTILPYQRPLQSNPAQAQPQQKGGYGNYGGGY